MPPSEIQNYLALPDEPNMIVDVTVPKGTKLFIGIANSQKAGDKFKKDVDGGGTQVFLQSKIPKGNFTNPRKLK